MPPKTFYAVQNEKKEGNYKDKNESDFQVEGYYNSKYRNFNAKKKSEIKKYNRRPIYDIQKLINTFNPKDIVCWIKSSGENNTNNNFYGSGCYIEFPLQNYDKIYKITKKYGIQGGSKELSELISINLALDELCRFVINQEVKIHIITSSKYSSDILRGKVNPNISSERNKSELIKQINWKLKIRSSVNKTLSYLIEENCKHQSYQEAKILANLAKKEVEINKMVAINF